MSESIEIIRATIEHAQLISEMGGRLFEETFRGTCSDADMAWQLEEYYNVDQVRSELADDGDLFYLILAKGIVEGYSRMKEGCPPPAVLTDKKSIELKRLYMERRAHGKGLAAKLMQFNLDLARTMNYERVYLSVWEHNERAKAFYSKVGFTETGIENPFPIGQTPQTDLWLALNLE
jgi:diamine N-acetyltransferase